MKISWTTPAFRRMQRCLLSLGLVVGVFAQAAAPEPTWQPTADGSGVVSRADKLVWDRCVHGQHWNGQTCEGAAVLLSQGEGVALASERNQSGGNHCRLPILGELKAMAARNAATGKKSPLFPPIATGWRWSGSRVVDTATVNQYSYGNVMRGINNENVQRIDLLHAWAVDVLTGEASKDVTKRTRLPVQLVCSLP